MIRDRWKVFVQVAELGSLTKAAALRDSAQSAISRQITSLEAECGGRLFYRTGRGVALTEIGKRIFPRVKALIQETEQLTQELRRDAALPSGVVRLGIIRSVANPFIKVLFERARARFPAIQLHIFDGSTGQLSEWLINGHIDLAILLRYGRHTNPDDYPLMEDDTYLVGPAGDPLTKAPTIKFCQLDNLPLMLPGTPSAIRLILDQLAKEQGTNLRVILECETLKRDLAAQGGVYSVLWLRGIMAEVRDGRLQASRIVCPEIRSTLTLSTSRHHPPSAACREIASLVRQSTDVFCDTVTGTKPEHAPPQVESVPRHPKTAVQAPRPTPERQANRSA